MAWEKRSYKVTDKKPIFSKVGKRKDGKAVRIGTKVKYNDGRVETLLTPSGKGSKYVLELKEGKKYTNDGEVKKDRKGKEKRLSDTSRAYRSGYLQAQKDARKAQGYKGDKS